MTYDMDEEELRYSVDDDTSTHRLLQKYDQDTVRSAVYNRVMEWRGYDDRAGALRRGGGYTWAEAVYSAVKDSFQENRPATTKVTDNGAYIRIADPTPGDVVRTVIEHYDQTQDISKEFKEGVLLTVNYLEEQD